MYLLQNSRHCWSKDSVLECFGRGCICCMCNYELDEGGDSSLHLLNIAAYNCLLRAALLDKQVSNNHWIEGPRQLVPLYSVHQDLNLANQVIFSNIPR